MGVHVCWVSLGLKGTHPELSSFASPKHFPEERPSEPDYPTCSAWLHRLKCACPSIRGVCHHAIPCSKASHGSVHARNAELGCLEPRPLCSTPPSLSSPTAPRAPFTQVFWGPRVPSIWVTETPHSASKATAQDRSSPEP